MHDPRQPDLDAAKRLLHCIKESPVQGIQLSAHSDLNLVAYADYNWVARSTTRSSTSGYIEGRSSIS